ncbi:hypothetical protein [Pseudobacteriovorax antillogorgiicola]|uniref:Uncharacterized protein n=1 Tax=Pseudobacteriovorax antillogorgiicola TaxID=1513793 RepID=A0A1Y6B3S7_9BACT|nr:hypothetical protein [Pseudobacteriovorax antillogorgiicola]TCS59248.1 hypothetical protein EDD56_101151 [Pseudobacteriovorax antillogorgiicola]SME90087.1 hypothetical protein SAMN06296036_101335 [Pseudobacteriovorax antillogorgiicola]
MKAQSLFPAPFPWQTRLAAKLWDDISTLYFHSMNKSEDTSIAIPSVIQDKLNLIGESAALVPIEAFKTDPETLKPTHEERYFLSSGTTQEQRSRSSFSPDGLEIYRRSSVLHFYQVLSRYFEDPVHAPGLSLIPTSQEWPDSSLAQMVEWIGEHNPVSRDIQSPLGWSQAGWVFATGFHIVHAFDQGLKVPLPPGSIVIETGGTKGKSRSVSRNELHQMIKVVFALADEQIVSEYGMCELASQAYESTASGSNIRLFRFPRWVECKIQDSHGELGDQGIGALVVHDKARIDCPYPIRTQDLVKLNSDGSFALLGRVPGSVLKGCSLNAESLVIPHAEVPAKQGLWIRPDQSWQERLQSGFGHRLQRLIASKEYYQAVDAELGSQQITSAAIEDLLADIPKDDATWQQTLVAAGMNSKLPKQWLLIPPQTHGVAIIYPLIVANLLNLNVKVRQRRGHPKMDALLANFLEQEGCATTWLPNEFKIGEVEEDWDAILVFGSDETIDTIRSASQAPVRGFGTIISTSIITDVGESQQLASAKRDMLALAQLGCLSSRIRFVLLRDAQDDKELTNWDHSQKPVLSDAQIIGCRQALWSLWSRGISAQQLADGSISQTFVFDDQLQPESYLLPQQFSQATVLIRPEDEKSFWIWINKQPFLRTGVPQGVAEKQNLKSFYSLGSANRNPWSGYHQGQPLFLFETQKDLDRC